MDHAEYATALTGFRTLLETNPGNIEAEYGFGYALLKNQDPTGAQDHLCRARRGAAAETALRREIDGLLETNALTCP